MGLSLVHSRASGGGVVPAFFRDEVFFPPGPCTALERALLVDFAASFGEKEWAVAVVGVYERESREGVSEHGFCEDVEVDSEGFGDGFGFQPGNPDISARPPAAIAAGLALKSQSVCVPE